MVPILSPPQPSRPTARTSNANTTTSQKSPTGSTKPAPMPPSNLREGPEIHLQILRKRILRTDFLHRLLRQNQVNYRYIYNQINAGAGIRNIARDLALRDSTITNRINRLARNALILNQVIVDLLPPRGPGDRRGCRTSASVSTSRTTTRSWSARIPVRLRLRLCHPRRTGRMTGKQKKRPR
jgi:hypothetical protein